MMPGLLWFLLVLHYYKGVLPFPFPHQQVNSNPLRAEIMYRVYGSGHVLSAWALSFQVTSRELTGLA